MGRPKGRTRTRRDVINAAVLLIREYDAAALTIKNVAARLGIRPPSLYHHVKNNLDLHQAVALEGNQRLMRGLEAVVATPGSEQLMAMALAYRDFASSNAALYKVMFTTQPNDDAASRAQQQQQAEAWKAGLGANSDDAEQQQHQVRAFQAAIHGFVILENAGQFAKPPRSDASFQHLIDKLITRD